MLAEAVYPPYPNETISGFAFSSWKAPLPSDEQGAGIKR
jgi:hypothetical protein